MRITLVQTFPAVFYAPFYAAHALGAYAAEGLDVRLETARSVAVTPGGMLDGDADVSWGGPMRLLAAHDAAPRCDLVGFCEVVTRDPFFVVGRAPRTDFALADLAGLRLGAVSEVPTPWLCLQDDLRRAGIDPERVMRAKDATMAGNVAAFRAGALDAVQVPEPWVTELAESGEGHVWYAAASRGPTSYTTLFARRGTLADRAGEMAAMVRAVAITLRRIHAMPPADLAAAVAPFLPPVAPAILTAAIARYLALGVWGRDPVLPRAGFERLRAACLSGGLIRRGADYEDCVDNSFAYATINLLDQDPAG